MDRGTRWGRIFVYFNLLLLAGITTSCNGTDTISGGTISTGPSNTLTVAWTANREKAVNSTGGGYRVYYATSPGVDTASASFINVPYISGGATATTTTFFNPAAATYYFRIVAYSTLNPPSGSSIRRSADSAEIALQYP